MKFAFLIILILAPVGASQADDPKPPFSVAVVPSKSIGQRGSITMAPSTLDSFYVVLTNISKEPQCVWEYKNSWGYQTIWFELTTSDGNKIDVVKRGQGFTRNFPSTFMIQPGESQVYSVRLDADWEAQPALPKVEETPVTLKAIYDVPPTSEAVEYKVWTGRTESHPYKFTLKLR